MYDRLRIAAARQRPAKRPGNIEPCIPTLVSKAPEAPQWIYEIKHDGYRLIARKRGSRVRLFTRNGFDWSDRYPRISEVVADLRMASATIDGEAVWCGDDPEAGDVRLLREPGETFFATFRASPRSRRQLAFLIYNQQNRHVQKWRKLGLIPGPD